MSSGSSSADPTGDPSGHEHCSCVERLRQQNHDFAAAQQKRTSTMESDLAGLRHLMREAMATHRKGPVGISAYGQAALAAALKEADEATAEFKSLRDNWHRERRHRISLEADLDRSYRTIAKLHHSSALQARTTAARKFPGLWESRLASRPDGRYDVYLRYVRQDES